MRGVTNKVTALISRSSITAFMTDGLDRPKRIAGSLAPTRVGLMAFALMAGVGDGNLELLPTYVQTASPVITLPVEASLYSGVSEPSVTQALDGWTNDADRALGVAPIEGCEYPDTWRGEFEVLPVVPCTVESAGQDDRRRGMRVRR